MQLENVGNYAKWPSYATIYMTNITEEGKTNLWNKRELRCIIKHKMGVYCLWFKHNDYENIILEKVGKLNFSYWYFC